MLRWIAIVSLSLIVLCAFATAALAAPIHDAAAKGDLTKVKSLIKKNPALVKAVDKDGATPLHYAAAADKKDVAKALIDAKANVNAAKKDGVTPLHVAASLGKKDICELLIASKAEVNVKDKQGRTPLALAREKNQIEIVQLLLAHGAVDEAQAPAVAAAPAAQPSEDNSTSPEPPVAVTKDLVATSKEIISYVVKQDFARVETYFDSNMKAAMPAPQLRQIWQMAISQLGAFQSVSDAQQLKAQGYDVVHLTCVFAKNTVKIEVAFNTQGQVSGLHFLANQ